LTILNPDHLFEQADRLIVPVVTGRPRQADLRRAISSAYYGVFHSTLTATADEFVGAGQRATSQYVLVYRSVDHRALSDLCTKAKKLPPEWSRYAPPGGFSPELRAFASAVIELQQKRHAADYDPSSRFKTSDASVAVGIARDALTRWRQAAVAERRAFLRLLIFKPR
jgi:hypothetical protein